LLDYANQEREAGKSIADAAAKAVELRFRPLLTTTVTTVASLIPLAVTDPFWEPLAITIITGLAASTFTVILAFPAYFWLFEQGRGLKRRLVTKFR
jgi:multidrug efflux pump subunit AcrB